mmetsp:Transcript_20763/g.45001  ORF Transcript_20763/g.45001 Transcript_20763/m.45001 type:complete len:138 (-) Transcript_20763:679-1092(-)
MKGYANQVSRAGLLPGPISFQSVVGACSDMAVSRGQVHILVILLGGDVDEFSSSLEALTKAARTPLVVLCVGVGDGPWHGLSQLSTRCEAAGILNFSSSHFDHNATDAEAFAQKTTRHLIEQCRPRQAPFEACAGTV